MQRLLLTTAILAGTTAFAQAQDATSPFFEVTGDVPPIHASDFIGMRVYAAETPFEDEAISGADEAWNDIGEINDVILDRDGSVDAVLVDIGGFLGMGEHQVALSMDSIRFVGDDSTDDPQDYFLVVNAPRATLETSPEFSMDTAVVPETDTAAADSTAQPADSTAQPADGQPVTDMAASGAAPADNAATESEMEADATADAAATTPAPADGAVAPADNAVAATEPPVDATTPAPGADVAATEPVANPDDGIVREGYSTADAGTLTSEQLTGARVYGSDDEDVGEIAELVLTEDGQITDAVIDVGGFLGIGEKPVAVKMEDLQILHANEGDDLRVYIGMTADELKALPRFEG